MKEYLDVDDIQEMVGCKYESARKIIVEVRERMKREHYYLPKCRKNVVLRWMVEEKLGLKKKKRNSN